MLYHLGKFLQIIGLVTALAALIVGFQTTDSMTELKMLAAGAVIFTAGWLAEKKGGKSE